MQKKIIRPISAFNSELISKGFNAFPISSDGEATRVYSRKDFYKICINTGTSIVHYSDRSFEVAGPILFFGNPHIPYSWQTISPKFEGYACLFSKDFLNISGRTDILQQSPFFKIGGTPVLNITEQQRSFLGGVFEKMIEEQDTDYTHKNDLIRNYINLIIHEAMKLQPSFNYDRNKNANFRIASVFLESLERQFPIETPDKPLQLRTAQDFADNLALDINYLNRAVKAVTGKPTSAHIAERIINEARILLQHTDWNISEIAFALGFNYPTYFNNYFKRLTGSTPMSLRASKV